MLAPGGPILYAPPPMSPRCPSSVLLAGALVAALSVLGAGCAPEIGDSCSTSTDCSIRGERICDIAQTGGYCTVRGCDPDTCPDGALCVEWRYEPPITAETWCMEKCGGNGGCRQNDGYRCVRVVDEGQLEYEDAEGNPVPVGDGDEPLARIIDRANKRRDKGFCAAVPDPR